MFIQYMAEQGHNVVKSERKPRRNIQYRDLCKSLTLFWHPTYISLANAVARLDNLEFLVDIVPRTIPYKQVKEKKAPVGPILNGEGSMETGQTTLNVKGAATNGTNEYGHDGNGDDADDLGANDPSAQLRMEIRGAGPPTINGDQTSQDVEMSWDDRATIKPPPN